MRTGLCILAICGLGARGWGQVRPANYEDDVKAIFARRCLGCHNAGEMRAGLNLESFAGVLKGGGSGDAVIAGRAAGSLLYRAVAREDGAPQMPLGQAKLPDGEISTIREWIQQGLLETAVSTPRGAAALSLEYKPGDWNRAGGPAAMPESLAAVTVAETGRAQPVKALAASPWAPLLAVAGHERIYLFNLAKRAPAGELAFPEGIPFVLRFSRDGAILLAAGGRGVESGKAVLFDVRSGKRLAEVGKESDIVLAADVSADGKLVALGGPGKVVKVFSVADGKLIYQIAKHTDWITAIEFSPDGALLATADRSGGIFLWDSAGGGGDRGFDARDPRLRIGAGNIGHRHRHIAEPAAVRRPAVGTHRIAPADHVVTGPRFRIRGLEYDPAMHRENAFPGAGRAGEHDHTRRHVVCGQRQRAGARPVGVAPAAGAANGGVERGAGDERHKKHGENREHDELSVGMAGGRHAM